MAVPEIFDLMKSPLTGVHLIEASAGTGKTYTITGMVLRLVLEAGIPIQEILVVTFTEAATAELKERIRTKLEEALRDLMQGTDFSGEKGLHLHRLRMALNDFDQASIFTIHGFCHKVLRENAFESGALLDLELVTDQENFVAEVVQDFWREHFYGGSALFVAHALSRGLSPQFLRATVRETLPHPGLKVVPQTEPPETSDLEQAYLECFEQLSSGWQRWRSDVERILLESKGLNRHKYRVSSVPTWVEEMDELVASGGKEVVLPESFPKFTTTSIAGASKKGETSPEHPFFHVCERFQIALQALADAFEQRILALKARLVIGLQQELARRKEERHVLYFDDLLLRVRAALREQAGESLVGILRQKFKAALIDEFQDTDSVQYEIFQKVFDHPEGTLFLIGDPKQAIYGFRGADIFAYMRASRSISSRFTLHENWRSEPHAVDGLNALFDRVHRPFIYDEIPFFPVSAAVGKKQEPLLMDGRMEPSVRLWVMPPQEGAEGKRIPKTSAREEIARAVTREIARLVEGGRQGKIRLGDRALREGDLAVLVRTNREAADLQEKLARTNIHSVLYSTGNLFDSEESLHTEWLLRSLSDPSDERLVKRALVSLYFGLSGEAVVALEEHGAAWDDWLVRFHAYHDVWRKQGFFVMMRKLLQEEQVLARLMGEVLGERRCTNVLHLAEVLHRVSTEKHLGMFELVKWLTAQRQEEATRLEEHQLRLESDEDAVKLVTIHRSKGLEYPVVFCPFLWGASTAEKKKPALFHDPRADLQLTLDLGSPDLEQSLPFKEKELLAENIRLAYVAVTRARSRCYLVWGLFNDAETSAPSYLFHYGNIKKSAPSDAREQRAMQASGGNGSLPDDLVADMAASLKALSHEELLADLEAVRAGAAHAIAVEEMPSGEPVTLSRLSSESREPVCRVFGGNIPRDWRVSSFSSLVLGEPKKAELQDYDELTAAKTDEEEERRRETGGAEERTIFSFPRGAAAGIFMHEILETVSFVKRDDSALRDLVRSKLGVHGFEEAWAGVIERMVQNVLKCPLEGRDGRFTLGEVPDDKRLNELEFYFPLQHLGEERLEEILAPVLERKPFPGDGNVGEKDTASPGGATTWLGSSGGSRREQLRLEPLSGFMKGFIDLVFEHEGRYYIVDWKSNHLGNQPQDYSPAVLERSMDEHLYTLQYHLYTVAVHQYLKRRIRNYDYDTHFGGVAYLFLRGIDPTGDSRCGVFQDRPSRETVEALCAGLMGMGVNSR